MGFIKDFKNLSKHDIAIAGGKGASLGEMTLAGIPVPPGFVILSSAFEKFLEETDLNVEINSTLNSVDYKEIHLVENASEKIKALILRAEMPKIIADEIQKSFKNIDSKFVAVRSSATAEDSSAAAWAGQLESYLNTTEKDLLENVKKCWASLFTPRAIFYRFDKKMQKQKISVAVAVQKMIESEVSGIAFSVHPVTQDENQIIIEAGFGLGEAIVSGQITPDSYVIEKDNLNILDKNINKQERMIARSEIGGNEWQIVPSEKQKQQKLSDNEILGLSKLTKEIENHYGFPCDIEWAEYKGKFYVIQSRPITTLFQKDDNINRLTKELNNLNWSLLGSWRGSLLYLYLERAGQSRNYYRKNGMDFELKNNPVINNEESYVEIEEEEKLVRKLEKSARSISFLKQHSRYSLKRIEKIRKFSIQFRKTNFALLGDKQLVSIFFNFTSLLKDNMSFIYTIYYLSDILEKQSRNNLKKLGVSGDRMENYLVSLTYPKKLNFLKQEERDFLRLAGSALSNPEKEKAINKHYDKYFWLNVYSFEGKFFNRDYFIRKLKKKSFNLKGEIKSLYFIEKKRSSMIREFIRRYKPSARLIDFFDLVREYNYLRDMRYDIFNFSFGCMLSFFKELACRLKLKSWKEVVYLTPGEIIDSLNKSATTISRNQIKERRKGFSILLVDRKINVYSGEDNIKLISYFDKFKKNKLELSKKILNGIIGNKGIFRGKVAIAFNSSDFSKLGKGCVLVVKMIPLDLTRAKISHCGAIIADLGGSLSHAAILARELKLPCIVGTKVATKNFKNGDLVEVNADEGIVKKIK